MSDFTPGSTFGDYEILGELGRGGMGIVYRARDSVLHRVVALKIIPKNLAANRDFRERLMQEARAAAQLNHPNIVTIYQVGEGNGNHFIAMEFVEGVELSTLIRQQGRISIGLAVDYASQVSSALEAAHARGIIHRDIKPQNIMLDRSGRVRVMDFGIAKVGEALSTIDTNEGAIMGTPAYMAPEQFLGRGVDERCDIYALGVVLYQMLVGKVPFRAHTPGEVMQKVLNEEAEPLDSLDPQIPPRLAAIVARTLAKEPDKRFSSAQTLLSELRNYSAAAVAQFALRPDDPTEEIRTHQLRTDPGSKARAYLAKIKSRPYLSAGVTVAAIAILILLPFTMGNSSGHQPSESAKLAEAESPILPDPNDPTFLGQSLTGHSDSSTAGEIRTQLASLEPKPPPDATPALLEPLITSESDATPPSLEPPNTRESDEPKPGTDQSRAIRRALALYSGTGGRVDERTARELMSAAAAEGDPLAKMWTAWFAHWGRSGFDKDPAQAERAAMDSLRDIRKLARSGNPDAMFLLGSAMEQGMGTEVSRSGALKWLNSAIDEEQSTAMNYLGWLYYSGRRVDRDFAKAHALFSRAARTGDVTAMHNLGWMYVNGEGVERNDRRAVELFRRAALAGSPSNMNNLGWMFEMGRGVPQNLRNALQWYRKAAILDDPKAQENLKRLAASLPPGKARKLQLGAKRPPSTLRSARDS